MPGKKVSGGPFAPLTMFLLITDEPLTVEQLSFKTGMTTKRVQKFIGFLHDQKHAYIEDWDEDATGIRRTSPAWRFTLVPKPDAKRPAPMTRKQRDARSYERKKGKVASVFFVANRMRPPRTEKA